MKKRFSVEQIVAVLKQVELGLPVADATRQIGVSEQSYYRWKKMYGGLQSDQVRELKQLQDENARLKRLVADLSVARRSGCECATIRMEIGDRSHLSMPALIDAGKAYISG